MSTSKKNRQRLDDRVLELGLFDSRQVAQSAIMDGAVLVDGQKVTKPGSPVTETAKVELLPGWGPPKFVSRGGLKLEKALDDFHISPKGRICLDVGASTGGFTDCLLKHGAALVYAIDVGYGQLDWSLRNHPQVVVKERLNARNLTADQIYPQGPGADLAVIDVSFISLSKIIPAVKGTLSAPGEIITLIKPQFEAGKAEVAKGGVVKSPDIHARVIRNLFSFCTKAGLYPQDLTYSPLKGPAGNIEYLAYFSGKLPTKSPPVDGIVEEAQRVLNCLG